MLRFHPPNLHFAGEPLDSIWPLRVWQRLSSRVPTIKPVMLGVRGVNREQHVMTGAFLDWVAFQLSGQRSSALTHSTKTPAGLLLEAEGHRNTTHDVHAEHRPLWRRLGRGSGRNPPRNLSLTSNQAFKSLITLSSQRNKPQTKRRARQRCDQISR